METGTPRWAASSVSAQPHRARASARTDARVTNERITQLLETDGARRGLARPKGSGFSSGCEPVSHAERQVESRVETHAEHAHVPAGDLFIVIREVHAQHAKAQVRTEDVTELRGVSPTAHIRVPDARREVRLDAEAWRGQRDADTDRSDDAGCRRAMGGGVRAGGTSLQVDRDGEQRAADQPEVRVAAETGDPLGRSLRLPALHAGRERDRRETERCPAAPRVALAVIRIRLGVVTADGDSGAALGAIPHRLA